MTVGEDGDAILWVVRGAAAETLSGHTGSAFSPHIADDGNTIYTASLDGTVLIWDLSGGRRLGRDPEPATAPLRAELRRAAPRARAARRPPQRRRDADADAPPGFPVVEDSGIERPGLCRGRRLPARKPPVGGGRHVRLGRPGGRGPRHRGEDGWRGTRATRYRGTTTGNVIWTPGVSADGRLVATGSKDGEVRFWSMPDGRPQGAPLRFPYGGGRRAAQSRRAAVVDGAAHPRRRAGPGGDLERPAAPAWRRCDQPPAPPVRASAPTGGASRSATRAGRVLLYSTATWKPVTGTLTGGTAGWLTFSPDSRTLAAGNSDGTVRLWDVRSGQALAAPAAGPAQLGRRADVHARGHAPHRRTGQRPRVPLGHPARVAHQARMLGRRPPAHPRRVEGVPPRRDYDPAC